jgi:hypothetical protein
VTGAENIPAWGGAILAGNHLSVVDSVWAACQLSGQEYVRMFASDRKAELAGTPPAPESMIMGQSGRYLPVSTHDHES